MASFHSKYSSSSAPTAVRQRPDVMCLRGEIINVREPVNGSMPAKKDRPENLSHNAGCNAQLREIVTLMSVIVDPYSPGGSRHESESVLENLRVSWVCVN